MKKSQSPVILARIPLFPLDIVREIYSLSRPGELAIYLAGLMESQEIKKALHSINPVFAEQIFSKKIWSQKEVRTLCFYILRMAYRPTPLSLIAGVAKLEAGKYSSFLKNKEWKLEQFSEPYRTDDVQNFLSSPKKFTYLTNPSLVIKGNSCWFIDWVEDKGHRIYSKRKVELGPEALALLNFCKTPRNWKDLITFFDVSPADSEAFIQFLNEYVTIHLLEADTNQSLVEKGKRNPNGSDSASGFTQVKIQLPENEISDSQIQGLNKAIHGLYRISKVWSDHFSPWYSSLKNDFRKHYPGKSVPLLDFILFHLPLTDERLEDDILDSPEAKIWLDLFNEAANLGTEEIVLSEVLINKLTIASPPETRSHPDPAYSIIFSLGKEKGKYRGKYVFGVQGWEGVRGYSRFSGLHPEIKLPLPPQKKGKIFVDLEFFPGGIATGISIREQSLSDFVRLSHVKVQGKRNYLNLEDIEVTLQNDLFRLHCRKSGKEIIPVMTSAHIVHAHGHPVFRFFGFIAAEGKKTFLDVPWLPNSMSYLPTISYRGYIFSSRRWKLRAEVLWSIAEDPELRRKMNIPRWVIVREQDNTLPFDLESPISLELLKKYQADRPLKVEAEWNLTHGEYIRVGDKSYSQEILFQWKVPDAKHLELGSVTQPAVSLASSAEKIHSYHFQMPAELFDTFLMDVLIPQAKKLKKNGIVSGFYFIKYPEPRPHIRFRLFAKKSDFNIWDGFFLRSLMKRDDFLVQEASEYPFELELETYGGKTGLAMYHEISSIMSEFYSLYQSVRKELSLPGHWTYGDPVDVAWLCILQQNLGLKSVPEMNEFSEVKRGRSHYLKNYSQLIAKNSPVTRCAEKLMLELAPSIKKLDRQFKNKKIQVAREFFLRRLIHMEVFRITDGSPKYLEMIASAIFQVKKK